MPESKYQFKDLVDVNVLQTLTDELYTATGIPSAIITMDGEILTGSGWQRICTEFHRRHPVIERECIASDTAIRQAMDAGESYVMYRCPRGLVDASSPILIEGEHVANVFAGQLFTEPPDAATEEFFRQSARAFGLDAAAYLEAFREVPVFPEAKFRPALAFLAKFANLVGSIGLARKREREAADHLRRSEDALRESEARYRTLAESAQDAIFIVDNGLQVRYVNEFGARALGSSSDALVGKRLADVFPPELAEQYSRSISRVCSTGEPFYAESLSSFAGHEVVLGTRLTPLRDEAGVVTSVLGLSRDITERKRAEESARQLERLLKDSQKSEAVLMLAGGIAHDFNNLLTVVMCNADLAVRNLHPGSPITANLQAVITGASRAAELTGQLLAYTGSSPGVPVRVNLSSLAREAVGTMRAALPLSARLTLELSDDVPAIEGDSTDLHRVLVNLLVNASEALGEDAGVICVRTGVVPRDLESVPAAARATSVHRLVDVFLEVEDTGCGMDVETQDRIFEPFFSTKFMGRGLGLAATAGIIRAHGGTVSVKSGLGKGSTFRVQFPAVGAPVAESTRGESTTWRGHGTVLVIDDQPAIRKVASEMLAQHGFQVISAGDGEAGLRAFDAHRDDVVLVLLDLVMPRMHGAQTLEELRRRAPSVPVVILTGLPSESRKVVISPHFAVPLLRKPFTMDALIAKVREAMGEASAAAVS